MAEEVVSLKKSDAGDLASSDRMMVVGELERALLQKMPAADACSWDMTGLLVGNPMDTVRGVAVALDPTIAALEEAHTHGANVLLTHHPVFLDAPTSFMPQAAAGHTPGAVVRRACELGISVISFHTALDVSTAGLDALPTLLRLAPLGVLDPLPGRRTRALAASAPLLLAMSRLLCATSAPAVSPCSARTHVYGARPIGFFLAL